MPRGSVLASPAYWTGIASGIGMTAVFSLLWWAADCWRWYTN